MRIVESLAMVELVEDWSRVRARPKVVDVDTRSVMVLQREAARMKDAAERVDLVVRAMALRRGIRPTQVENEPINLFEQVLFADRIVQRHGRRQNVLLRNMR